MSRVTSLYAYDMLKRSGDQKNQKRIIAETLIYYPEGLSLKEICRETGFEINVVSGRVNDLKKLGVLDEMPKRKCSITSRTIIPVAVKTSPVGDQLSII